MHRIPTPPTIINLTATRHARKQTCEDRRHANLVLIGGGIDDAIITLQDRRLIGSLIPPALRAKQAVEKGAE